MEFSCGRDGGEVRVSRLNVECCELVSTHGPVVDFHSNEERTDEVGLTRENATAPSSGE
jgi:hypothetical protein